MIRDISERKRMEEAVRESEERFRQLAESIDAVFGSRRRTNAKSHVSPAFETIWGISSRRCTRILFWLDHIHPDDQKRVSIAAACRHICRMTKNTGSSRRADESAGWDRSFVIKNAAGNVPGSPASPRYQRLQTDGGTDSRERTPTSRWWNLSSCHFRQLQRPDRVLKPGLRQVTRRHCPVAALRQPRSKSFTQTRRNRLSPEDRVHPRDKASRPP